MSRVNLQPRRLGEGEEPDPRFTLANERTFLAWIRTSLALLAVGMAVVGLDLPVQRGCARAASVVLVVLGTVAPAEAWWSWLRTEHALRTDRPLPHSPLALPMGVGLVAAAVLLGVGSILG